jgi:hypothetical protein
MDALERLFRLEIEFHRQRRNAGALPQVGDAAAVHTSYAIRHGYEGLLDASRAATGQDIEALKMRLAFAGDPRDVLAARDSLKALFGISLLEP